MFLKSITLVNFRCYDEETVDLRSKLTLVTGENDGGKTALLTAIELLLSTKGTPQPKDFRQESEGSSSVMRFEGILISRGTQTRIRRCFTLDDGVVSNGTIEVMRNVPSDSVLREADEQWGSREWKAKDEKRTLQQFNIEPESNSSKRTDQFDALVARSEKEKAWGEAGTSLKLPSVDLYGSEDRDDPQKRVEKMLQSALEDHFTSTVSSSRYHEIRLEMEKEANSQLEEIAGIFGRYDYRDEKTDSILRATPSVNLSKGFYLEDLQVNYHGSWTPLENLGAAKRRKLELTLLEWDRKQEKQDESPPRVLLYDEPDLHFDYAGQRRMSELLRGIAEKNNTQVVVATHSLSLIDRMRLDSIVYLQHDPSGARPSTAIRTPGGWEDLSELAAALGVRNHIILNACLFLVEGPTEEYLVPKFFLKSRGYQLASIGVEMLHRSISGGGGYDPGWVPDFLYQLAG